MGKREVRELKRIRQELQKNRKTEVTNMGNGCIKVLLLMGVIVIILAAIIIWILVYL